jgi:protein gp37
MTEATLIEWADSTFNPWEGCQKVGPGCDHCYAEMRNARFAGGVAVNWGPGAPRRRTSVANWRQPIAWNAGTDAFEREHGRRRRVFCASLADWLDNAVPIEWLVDLLDIVRVTIDLDWLMLTKRIGMWLGRLRAAHAYAHNAGRIQLAIWISTWLSGESPANLLIGATIVNQAEADRDIPKLLAVPAARRFLSMEPLLGPVDLTRIPVSGAGHHEFDPVVTANALKRAEAYPPLPQVDWVIVGGESGPDARPMHPDWARGLRDQCAAAGVPFLFKQWGEWLAAKDCPGAGGERLVLELAVPTAMKRYEWQVLEYGQQVARVGKKAAGRLLDGFEHNGFPEAACAS